MKQIMKYTLWILGAMLLLSGCIYDGERECTLPQGDDDAHLIRISAQIIPNRSRLRADVTPGKDSSNPDTPFTPEVITPEAYEERIDHVMLYVYKYDKLIKTIFYHDVTLTEGMPTAFDGLEVKTFGRNGSQLTFDLKLAKGTYRFILLANDRPALLKAKGIDPNTLAAVAPSIRKPEEAYQAFSATNTPRIYSSHDLATSLTAHTGSDEPFIIPMVGQAMLEIKDGNEDGTPTQVVPEIKIERVMARVDFYLTTANEALTEYHNDGNAVFASDSREYTDGGADSRRTKGLYVDMVTNTLLANHYVALPHKGEFTATGDNMKSTARLYSTVVAPFDAITNYRNAATQLLATSFDPEDTYKGEAHPTASGFRFAKVYQQAPQVSLNGATMRYSLYLFPMDIQGAEEKDMPYLLVGFNGSNKPISVANPADKAMTYFKLPISTIITGTPNSEAFIIRRNTVYEIKATLDGRRIILEDGVKVLPWIRVDQDIEIDPTEPGIENPLN